MPQRPAARLTQRRYDDDPEVRDRAPARGESWIPPLGPPRKDGPLEAPTFDDAAEEDAGEAATAAAVVKAATPEAGPTLDEDAALVDELGDYDEAEAFMASISG